MLSDSAGLRDNDPSLLLRARDRVEAASRSLLAA
jgi:hypothetical protein